MSSTKKASTTAKPKTSSTRKTSSTKPASTKPASSTKRSSTTSKPSSTSRSSTPPVTSIPSTSSELPESTTSVSSEEPSSSSSEPFQVPPVFSSSPSLPSSSESSSTSLSSSFSQTPILPSSSETSQPSSSSSSSSSLDVGVGGISEPPEIKPIPVGAVAGGAVGGLVVGCLAVIGIVFCLRKRKAKRLSSRISTSDPKHPFFPMDTFAASTTEFTPVPYPVNAASPTRSDEQKVRLSAPRYSSPYVASQRGSTSPSSFQLESDPFATHTNVTSRIDMPYRDNSTPTQQTPPSSVTTSSEKEVGRRRLVVSGTGTSRSELPVLQHEDSGVRVTGREQGVIEVPPAYTPR